MTVVAVETRITPAKNNPKVWASDHDHVVFSFDRFFTMVWTHETRPDAVEQASSAIIRYATSLAPSRFCLLTVVGDKAPLPVPSARAGLAELLRANTRYLVRSAVAYEGLGFRAAAVRGVATGIAVMSNHQFPHRIFADVGEAAEWLASGLTGELGRAPDGRRLAMQVERHRRSLTPV